MENHCKGNRRRQNESKIKQNNPQINKNEQKKNNPPKNQTDCIYIVIFAVLSQLRGMMELFIRNWIAKNTL